MMNGKQTGIALITVLLVLSLATVAAVSMTTRQQLDIRRTTNVLRIEEGYMALLAAEEFAKALLLFDLTQTVTPSLPNNLDGLGDYWNSPDLEKAVQTVGNFTVTNLTIEDLQGRFNINNLLTDPTTVSQNNYENFQILLGEYGLRPELANVAVDWMDEVLAIYQQDGAEDTAYQSMTKPYLPPNREMASASEINRLMGVNLSGQDDYDGSDNKRRKILAKMLLDEQKVLIALPRGTPINVNTPSSSAIFKMIVPGLSDEDAESLYESTRIAFKSAPPFKTAADFWGHSLISARPVAQSRQVAISVNSQYFLLRAQAIHEDLVVYSNTIFYRTAESVRVVHRSYGRAGEI